MYNDKYNVFVELNNNNEINIEIENIKYNLEEFISKYSKDENKIEKNKFIYKRKRGQIQNRPITDNNNEKEENNGYLDNEHQKKKKKKKNSI